MRRFVLRLGSDAPNQVSWVQLSEEGGTRLEVGTLAEAGTATGRDRVTVLVPGQDVLLLQAKLPKGGRQRIAQAIPFAVEEEYISDAEELHFCQGERNADGLLALGLVSTDRMEDWLAMLQEAGIDPHSMVPEALAVPLHPEGWSIVIDGELALVRTGMQQGFVVDTVNLESLLRSELDALPEGEPIALHLYAPQGVDLFAAEAFSPHYVVAEVLPEEVPALLTRSLDDKTAIDLLQGPYNRHAQWGNLWGYWRLPAALLIVFLLLQGGLLLQEYYALRQESQYLTRQIEQVYRERFPEAKKIVNPRAQMEHQLTALRSGGGGEGGFLGLVGKSTAALLDTPGFTMESMRYADGRLDLGFLVGSLQGLDALKERLAGMNGLAVEIRTASAKGDIVEARMQIKESGQ